jgi:hypothetical protein
MNAISEALSRSCPWSTTDGVVVPLLVFGICIQTLALADPDFLDGEIRGLGLDSWLDHVHDSSLMLESRLESVVMEDSFSMWVSSIASRPAGESTDPSSFGSSGSDQLLSGYRAIVKAIDMLEAGSDLELAIDPDRDFANVLTDPRVPFILGDEIAVVLNGLAAGVCASILRFHNTDLSSELSTIFRDRMARLPKLVALSLIASGEDDKLWKGWEKHVSPDELALFESQANETADYYRALRIIAGG